MTVTGSSSNNSGGGGGITFLGLLTIAFIVLRLTGCIHWSWVWILAPLWIPAAIIAVILVIIILIGNL